MSAAAEDAGVIRGEIVLGGVGGDVRVVANLRRVDAVGGALHVFAHEAPDGQVVHHELVPVVLAHGALEHLGAFLRQHVNAQRGLRLVDAELELDAGIDELVTLQDLPEATPLVRRLLVRRGLHAAERELVVVVRLLGVVVRAHLVLPEDHAVAHGVLVIVLIRARGDRAREQKHEQRAGNRGGSREPGSPTRGLARAHRARSTDARPEATLAGLRRRPRGLSVTTERDRAEVCVHLVPAAQRPKSVTFFLPTPATCLL